nr:hypothetical protein [Tanacetum cinerariifolium]
MSKDQSISRDYKMFWHNARDDPMFNTIRVISRHHDTQVYGTILPDELTNQEMLDFKAYKEYYAVASGSEPPKAKTKLKSKVKVTKPDMKKQPANKIKAKGLAVLSKVTLSKAEQIKLATKRSKKDFHISHASSSGDGVDTQSKVPDKQVKKTSGKDEGTGTIPGVLDLPPYESKKETMDDEEDDEVFNELYEDVNVNLEQGDDEMTNVNQRGSEQHNVSQESGFKQEEEDTHVTLTPISNAQKADEPIQSSSVSSDFTSKFLNLENPSPADNEIASLMETSSPHATAIPKLTSVSCFQDERSSECGCATANKQAQRRSSSRESRLPQLDLEYLKGGDSSIQYSTSVTKTKATTYELKWIEDLVPELWSLVVMNYDQHAYFGTSHWGSKRQRFYGYASNLTSSKDVYSRRRIIAVTILTIMKKYDYDHLEEIEVRRDDQQLYMFKEGDFKRLHL